MINLNTVMLDKSYNPIKQNYRSEVIEDGKVKEINEYRETILMDILRGSLLKREEEILKPKDALKRYQLYRKLQEKEEVNLSHREIKYLSKLICSHYEILFAGQAIELLTN